MKKPKVLLKEWRCYLISELLGKMNSFVYDKNIIDIVIHSDGLHWIGRVYYKEEEEKE